MKVRLCHYCDKQIARGTATRDHIVPRGRGGLNVEWNVVLSCAPCNEKKAMDWPTCRCERCKDAMYRWYHGERAVVTRYDGKLPSLGQFCLIACYKYGCPGGKCKWPSEEASV